jgi:glycosyltransferase involved in cell wall biosynthesis
VLPSYAEGLPRTVLEAMSMGKPVIVTDVTGCRDLVVAEQTGLLCQVKDAQALADTIDQFTRLSVEQKTAMGLAGRERVMTQFSDALVVAQYEAFIRSLA